MKELILPGEAFLLQGKPAFILLPAKEKQSRPQPWIFYAPTVPGTPDIHEKWMHEKYLEAGIAVAGVDVGEAFGNAEARKYFTLLHDELTGKRGFAKKCCLLGRSRGGLFVTNWGAENVDKISGIAGIYPVFDLRSYPGLQTAAGAYSLTPEEMEKQLAKHNPIDKVPLLAKKKIPVYIIHGDVDKVVPLEVNSAKFVEAYENAGAKGLVTLNVVKGQGHNYWEGFFRCQELIDFAITRANAGAK